MVKASFGFALGACCLLRAAGRRLQAGSYAPNELPQPQVCFAFGLLNTKPFVRSAVSSLRSGVRYRGAVCFEHPLGSRLDVDGYPIPAPRAGASRDDREDATPLTL